MSEAKTHMNKWNDGGKHQHLPRRSVRCIEHAANASCAFSSAFLGVRRTRTDDIWQTYTRERSASLESLLYRSKKLAFDNLVNELGTDITDESYRLIVSSGAGRTVPRRDGTLAPYTRAFNEFRNRFCTIRVDAFKTTTCTDHEHGCTLKQV